MRKLKGFTLTEIMVVVLIIGILLGIAAPNFIRARETARKGSCVENLKKLDDAKSQWTMEYKKQAGDACSMADLVGASLYIRTTPICPAGGTYTVGVVGVNPSCTKSADGHVLP